LQLEIYYSRDLKQCPSITPIGVKFLSLFDNAILKSLKAFFQVDTKLILAPKIDVPVLNTTIIWVPIYELVCGSEWI
jgi:hypothetical protein